MTCSNRTAGFVSGKYVATPGAQWMSHETFTPVVSIFRPPHSPQHEVHTSETRTGHRSEGQKKTKAFWFCH